MKKILFLSIFFIISNRGYSQNLEYNRVIDTTLTYTMNIGDCYRKINQLNTGDYISPPQGKVWKVQSLIFLTPSVNDNNYMSRNQGGTFTNYRFSYANFRAIVLLKNGTVDELFSFQELPNQYENMTTGSSKLDNPLWLSTNEIGIGVWHNGNMSSDYVCMTTAYSFHIHLSIIEFNE